MKRKYGNTRVENPHLPGHWFDSKLERALYEHLALLQRGGRIKELKHHPGTVFLSEARIQYRPDFRFIDVKTGETQYAESKGMASPRWSTQKKMWLHYGPSTLYIYMGTERNLKLVETIIPVKK